MSFPETRSTSLSLGRTRAFLRALRPLKPGYGSILTNVSIQYHIRSNVSIQYHILTNVSIQYHVLTNVGVHASQRHKKNIFSRSGHCPISKAATHIGSSCACGSGQGRFVFFRVTGLGQSKAVPGSHDHEPIIPLFSRCRHCGGRVVMHSTNDHPVFITRMLSLSKIQAFLRTFYVRRYREAAKRCLCV